MSENVTHNNNTNKNYEINVVSSNDEVNAACASSSNSQPEDIEFADDIYVAANEEVSSPIKFFDRSDSVEIDVVDETDVVIPNLTTSGENTRTPTKKNGIWQEEVQSEEYAPFEDVFSNFPCQVVPDTMSRFTRTPIDGEHLLVRKNSNGRLRVYVKDHYHKFSPYSTMTHRPCIVCNRQMTSGEMHLNFPADLDRRRIWANLLGFKYKDILRSKAITPSPYNLVAGPICTEHFAEECFRNHNFNKAAIEAFGVPVAISPDVKTTPSKKRVPWVCTICDFNSCSVVELQTHLLNHTEEIVNNKSPLPETGLMCPFCRKCTYGYRTVAGFKRHLKSPPIQHCHLRRIYDFAKVNCRTSELEPIDSWKNWTRRNVYVAYHGCEPPTNEIVLTPSPTKSVSGDNKSRDLENARRKKAVRSLSFVGREGGTSVNDSNMMQRAVHLQVKKLQDHKYQGTEEDDVSDGGRFKRIITPVSLAAVRKRTSCSTPISESKSVTTSPVKKTVEVEKSSSTCPNTPKKARGEKNEKRIDEIAFAKMVEKRAKAVKRLMIAKMPTQPKKPRKAFTYTLPKTRSSTEISSDSQTQGSSEEPKLDEVTEIPEKEEELVTTDERPLKSLIARKFAAGERVPIPRYNLPLNEYETDDPESSCSSVTSSSVRMFSRPIVAAKASVVNTFSSRGPGPIRPSMLGRRPIILKSKVSKPLPVDASTAEKKEKTQIVNKLEKNGEKTLTLADVLDLKSSDNNTSLNDEELQSIAKELKDSPYGRAIEDAIKFRKVTTLRKTFQLSRQCMRQLEAARARALLFGDGAEERFDIMITEDGPTIVSKTDPEWQMRHQQQEERTKRS